MSRRIVQHFGIAFLILNIRSFTVDFFKKICYTTSGKAVIFMTKTAYFAGGCFWCITPFFKINPGVLSVTSGYSGGDEPNPTYLDVKHQKTHHRETVKVVYDPALVDYTELLDIFLSGVDPYDSEGQFIDRGHSYTLAVYYQTDAEKEAAKAMLTALEKESGQKTFVALEGFKFFVPAEEEHQDYYLKHPEEFEQELIDSGRKTK